MRSGIIPGAETLSNEVYPPNHPYPTASESGQRQRQGISSTLKDFDGEFALALSVLERVQRISDHLVGAQPRQVPMETIDRPEPAALVDKIRVRREIIGGILSQIASELNRIEGAL